MYRSGRNFGAGTSSKRGAKMSATMTRFSAATVLSATARTSRRRGPRRSCRRANARRPDAFAPAWKSTSEWCTRQFFTKSFLGDDAAVLAPSSVRNRRRHAVSRRRVGGVEVDAAIQDERAVNFDFHTVQHGQSKAAGRQRARRRPEKSAHVVVEDGPLRAVKRPCGPALAITVGNQISGAPSDCVARWRGGS